MNKQAGLMFIDHKSVPFTDIELKEDIELLDLFLMLKHHKAVITPYGFEFIYKAYDEKYIENANEKTELTDGDIMEALKSYVVEDSVRIPVLQKTDIIDMLKGTSTDYQILDNPFLLEEDYLELDDELFYDAFSYMKTNLNSINQAAVDRFYSDSYYLKVIDFKDDFEPFDYNARDLVEIFANSKKSLTKRIDEALKNYSTYKEEKNLFIIEKNPPVEVMDKIVSNLEQLEDDELDEVDRDIYALFLNRLVEHKDLYGLHKAAYAYYGGNRFVEFDYSISEQCLLELLKVNYSSGYANTLGYIYYYGRTNNGIPEYDKAYKYFTMAALTGEIEASYKLGDMYKNGFYVEKNLDVAKQIYDRLRLDALEDFYNNPYDSSLPDVYFRIGMMHENGPDVENYWSAAEMFLSSLCAIKMRNSKFDSKLKQGITNKLLTLYKDHKPEIEQIHPLYNGIRQMKDIVIHVDDPTKGNILLTFKNKKKVLVPDFHGMNCSYTDEVTIHFSGELLIPFSEDTIVDEIYEDELGDYVFYFDGVLLGKISKCNVKMIMDSPLVDFEYDDKEYRVAICEYNKGSGKTYTFLFEGEERLDSSWYVLENNKEVFLIEFKTLKGYELPVLASKLKYIKSK